MCGSEVATLPRPAHRRDAGSSGTEAGLAAASRGVGRGGFFSAKARFAAASQGVGRGGFPSPSLLTWTGGDGRRWLCRGEMCRPRSVTGGSPDWSKASHDLGSGFVPVQSFRVPGFSSISSELSVPAAKSGVPLPLPPSLPLRLRHRPEPSDAGDSAEIKRCLMDSGKDLLRPQQTGLFSPLTALRASPKARRDPSWDIPRGIPPRQHPKTSISGTSWGIFQWQHPPGSAFTWESIQAPTACRSPSHLSPPFPASPRLSARGAAAKTAARSHCPGQALTAATREEVWTPNKTGKAKETPEEVKRQTSGEINTHTTPHPHTPPKKNTMRLFEAGIKPMVPAAGLDLG